MVRDKPLSDKEDQHDYYWFNHRYNHFGEVNRVDLSLRNVENVSSSLLE